MSSVLAIALAVPALGGTSNPIATGAVSVKQIALKALKKAKQAQTTANTALSTANTALSTANTANTRATTADNKATAAQTTATAADNKATAAQTTANSKFGTLSTANSDGGSGLQTTASQLDTANCPAGFEPTGGGYTIGGVGSNDVTPNISTSYGTGWIVSIQEIGAGTADLHSVEATVNCIN